MLYDEFKTTIYSYVSRNIQCSIICLRKYAMFGYLFIIVDICTLYNLQLKSNDCCMKSTEFFNHDLNEEWTTFKLLWVKNTL